MKKSHNDPINRYMLPIAGVAILAVAAWLFFSDPQPFGRMLPIVFAMIGVIAIKRAF